MTPLKARLVLCSIAALFAGVIGNALYDQGARPARYVATAAAPIAGAEQPEHLRAEREQTLARVARPDAFSAAPDSFAESDRTTSRIGSLADRLLTHSLSAEDPETTSPELVKAIQRELLQRGYAPGTPDGVAGLVTRAAIMAFEHDAGLRLTGIVSEPLLKQLILGPSPSLGVAAIKPGPGELASDIIAHVQEQLSELGYGSGAETGEPGGPVAASGPALQVGSLTPLLAAAIRRFEHDSGLATTGRISGRLIAALGRRTGKGFALARRDTAPL